MIYAIDNKTEFGKEQSSGINLMFELTESGQLEYAHSKEQAIAYVQSIPAFADAIVDDLQDGRILFSSKWVSVEYDAFRAFFAGTEETTHSRLSIMIYPVSTVFELYKPY